MSDIIPPDAPLKQCKGCKNWYPATSAYFHKKETNRDKLQKKCKKCRGSNRLGIFHGSIGDGVRQCTKCLKILPATTDYFHRHPDGGLRPRCKSCRSEEATEYYLSNKEEIQATTKRYREKNRDKRNAHNRLYWASHGKEVEARRKASLEGDPSRKAKRARQNSESYYRYQAHRKAARQEHYRLHRDKYYAKFHKRRSRLAGIQGTHTAAQIAEQLKRQRYRCYYCHSKFEKIKGKYVYHIDHTFPLSRVVGMDIPANDISYLVLACPTCNLRKGNKFPWEWLEGGRLL